MKKSVSQMLAGLIVLVAAGLVLSGPSALASTTTWTGEAENNLWADDGNWSDGVPTSTVGAVFGADASGTFTIQMPDADADAFSLLFESTAGNITLSGDHDLRLFARGGSDWTIQAQGVHTQTVNVANIRFDESGGGTSARRSVLAVDNSAGMLRLQSDLDRHTGNHPIIMAVGFGTVFLDNSIHQITGGSFRTPRYDPTPVTGLYQGTVIVGPGSWLSGQQGQEFMNGTVVINGAAMARSSGTFVFGENQVDSRHAVLRGTGTIGNIRGGHDNVYNPVIENRAIVHPGSPAYPGQAEALTGNLRFRNFDVDFRAGSTLRLDLLDTDNYSSLTFAMQAGETDVKVPALLLAVPQYDSEEDKWSGVTLDLRLLDGFSANVWDTFRILDGYESISNDFVTPDGVRLVDGIEFVLETPDETEYAFRLNYTSNPGVTLTVIPEPGTGGLLLLGLPAALLFLRRRLRRKA